MMNALERLFVDSKLGVHVLVCVFAISSWVDINGMWVELPIFVTHLPEEWTLPSYITILSQIANIGPIIFIIIAYILKKRSPASKLTLDKVTSYAIMFVGLTSTLLLAFLWQRTAHVAGSERSVALLALSFFLAVMDCTSSLAYVAFLAALKPAYMASFFFGEGLSGFLPAMMALGQGAGDVLCVNGSSTVEKNISGVLVNGTSYFEYPTYTDPRFSVQLFFILLSALIFLSIVAFTLLNFWGYCKDEFVTASSYDLEQDFEEKTKGKSYSCGDSVEGLGISNPVCSVRDETPNIADGHAHFTDLHKSSDSGSHVMAAGSSGSGSSGIGSNGSRDTLVQNDSSDEGKSLVKKGEDKEVSMVIAIFLLVQVVIINFLITSFVLSVQTYSSLPYGISTYNLVVTLSNIANPLACFVSLFLAVSSPLTISALTSLGCACGAYIIVAATMSPDPPMVGHAAGGPVSVAVWVGASFFLTYAKVSVAGVMRLAGRRALIWYGVATQLGALIGAVTGFILICKEETITTNN
ncbi:solute carrier family 52, riboflavin transporter, member 3-B-like isoform X2 [Littorina saxatilis]|uniref:solute carrier family 52, riboflavin transporter, member 3-B-like isoform X2 n=1 Tax=Littorina saxatilis TaxID=31220 RepID=UPI0038B4F5ED